MRRFAHGIPFALLVIVVGCVIIPDHFVADITVTIRHVQEQADGYVGYVTGETDALPDFEEPEVGPTSWLDRAWNCVTPIQQAYAQAVNSDSQRAQQIAKKMRERYPEVVSIKKTGAVGENNRGFVDLKKPELLTNAEEKNRVQRICAAENADRKALYQEVARLNRDQNLSVSKVEKIYALEWFKRAKSGDLIQLPKAGEDFDTFKGTKNGKALGAQAKPEAWVMIP